MNLFKKAALITDIHFGYKSNSQLHNQDCLDFVNWAVKVAKREGCDKFFFLGDWHEQRSSINVSTLNYSLQALETIAKNFEMYFLVGNHDIYYRDKRDIQSAEWARNIKGINIINSIVTIGGVTMVPWMVNEEYKDIKKINSKYIFGHFELPYFKMNAMAVMPDHGLIQSHDFKNVGEVYSGHFHKRQSKNNITYIGNVFPTNYADTWDDDRGLAILEFGGEINYYRWPNAPKYRKLNLSTLLDNPSAYLDDKTYAQVTLDIDISYEEASFIKDELAKTYQMRELSLIPAKNEEHTEETTGHINYQSVDSIVTSQIQNIESDVYSVTRLLEIYNNLDVN